MHLDGPRRAKFSEDVETDPVPTGIASNPASADHTTIPGSGPEHDETMLPAAETRIDCRDTQLAARGKLEENIEITPELVAELEQPSEQPTERPKEEVEQEHAGLQIQELPEAAVVPELGGQSRSEIPQPQESDSGQESIDSTTPLTELAAPPARHHLPVTALQRGAQPIEPQESHGSVQSEAEAIRPIEGLGGKFGRLFPPSSRTSNQIASRGSIRPSLSAVGLPTLESDVEGEEQREDPRCTEQRVAVMEEVNDVYEQESPFQAEYVLASRDRHL